MSDRFREGTLQVSDGRRQHIMTVLRSSPRPVTGGDLATAMGVSRQVIVQDVALLRASGEGLIATAQGYTLAENLAPRAPRAILACRHNREETEDELNTIVDLGVKVIDVIVEHPIYGELHGLLALESRQDVSEFMRRLLASGAGLLSALTNGVHLHTVECPRPEKLAWARNALQAKGYLLSDADGD